MVQERQIKGQRICLNGTLRPFKGGCTRVRSTADQCFRLCQGISDGFQNKQPERIILTLLHFRHTERERERTWLCQKVIKKGTRYGLTSEHRIKKCDLCVIHFMLVDCCGNWYFPLLLIDSASILKKVGINVHIV